MGKKNKKGKAKKGQQKMVLTKSGLPNLGATCFMNAVLQALFGVSPFTGLVQTVLELSETAGPTMDIFFYLNHLQSLLATSDHGTIREDLGDAIREMMSEFFTAFPLHQQQDAHEFLIVLFGNLKDHTESIFRSLGQMGADSPVAELFETRLSNIFECTWCQARVSTTESMDCLSVNIPSSSTDEPCIQSLTDNYFHTEEVDFTCQLCFNSRAARRCQVQKPPRCLIIHLKRYQYNPEGFVKSHTDVKLQTVLQLDVNRAGEETELKTYRLVSVTSHLGENPSSGHYVSDVLCQKENKFLTFDDELVTESPEDILESRKSNCYVLFYVEETRSTRCQLYTAPVAKDAVAPSALSGLESESQ